MKMLFKINPYTNDQILSILCKIAQNKYILRWALGTQSTLKSSSNVDNYLVSCKRLQRYSIHESHAVLIASNQPVNVLVLRDHFQFLFVLFPFGISFDAAL